MDPLAIVEHVAIPFTAAVSAFVGAALNYKHQLASLKKEVDDLSKAQEGLGKRIEELKHEMGKLDGGLHSFRESSHDFARDAELSAFMTEQNERWHTIQRTLGELQGALNVMGVTQPRRR